MKISAHDWVLHLCLLGASLVCSAGSVAAKTVDDGIVITDVTLISPERKTPLPHVGVVIRGDRIAEIGSDLVAGPVHPNLCSCGRGVRIAGGYMAQRPPKNAAEANAANLVYEPAQTKNWPANLDPNDYSPVRAVARACDAGAICLKTFIEPGFGGAAHWPALRPETLAALRDEAKRHWLVFVIHANAVESWRAALDAKADVIAHGLWHWPGNQLSATPPREARDVIRAAAQAHVGVQPTLQAAYGDLSIFDTRCSMIRDSDKRYRV